MLKDILGILNEWWIREKISEEKAKPYKRTIFDELKDLLLNYRQIVALTGLRRVGKTTLIYQLIDLLLKKGTDPKSIIYFSFDEVVEEPMKILKEYQKLTRVNWKEEKIFVFFDEIHKLEDWSSKIKLLYDSLPNMKLTISGSASMIEKETKSNLAGRYFIREVKPLSLREFAELSMNREIKNLELWRSELEVLFEQYIRKPFPEIVGWEDEKRISEYIKELVIEKVKVDLPEIFKNVRTSLLSTLLEMFMKAPGMILNLSTLSRDLKVHKLTLSEHIFFLEFAKVIRTIKNFRPSIRAESRKMKKIYPTHIALSFPFYPSLDRGTVFENLVACAWDLKNYWRWGSKEIDFIKRNKALIPIEVKAKENVVKKDIKTLNYFMKKYKIKKGIVVYGGSERRVMDSIKLIPIIDIVFD